MTVPIDAGSGVREYRLKRSLLVTGVLCTAFFIAVGVSSVLAALWNIDGSFKRPRTAALVFGISWSCFTLLGFWIILAYFRERLWTADAGIRQRGCVRARTMRFDDVRIAEWRVHPTGGSIVLRDAEGKLKVEFNNFTRSDGKELIDFLRGAVNKRVQQGWDSFEPRYIAARPEGRRESRRAARRRFVRYAVLLFAAGAVFACVEAAGLGKGRRLVPVAILNVMGGIACLGVAWRLKEIPTPAR